MAQVGAISGSAGQIQKQPTLTERLMEARSRLRNTHGRLMSAAGRAGVLPPVPQSAEKAVPESADLTGIVADIEGLCEFLLQDCCEVEKIA
jgi:hypothetical protein